jgi:hypothetical protein
VHPNISSGREAVPNGDDFDSAREDVGIRISDDWGTRLAQTIDWTEWRIEIRVPAVGPGIGADRFGVSLVRPTRPSRPLILCRLLLRRRNVEGGGSREWSRSRSSLETRSTFSARNLRLRPGETVVTTAIGGMWPCLGAPAGATLHAGGALARVGHGERDCDLPVRDDGVRAGRLGCVQYRGSSRSRFKRHRVHDSGRATPDSVVPPVRSSDALGDESGERVMIEEAACVCGPGTNRAGCSRASSPSGHPRPTSGRGPDSLSSRLSGPPRSDRGTAGSFTRLAQWNGYGWVLVPGYWR